LLGILEAPSSPPSCLPLWQLGGVRGVASPTLLDSWRGKGGCLPLTLLPYPFGEGRRVRSKKNDIKNINYVIYLMN